MKKTKNLMVILTMLAILCCIIAFASCGTTGDNNVPTTPEKLIAPVVSLNGDTVTWSANISAEKFEISIDGNLSYIENTVTSRKLTNGQTFKIRAIGDGMNNTNSDWSNSVTYVSETLGYTIVWKNGDTVLETDTEVREGTVPTYDGAKPTKAADAQYSYEFAGWSPMVSEVVGDITYEAQFTQVLNSYTIIWKNGDVELEKDENVPYGSVPSYDGAEPTKAADAQYTYTFSGWTPEISLVTGAVTYQAQFDKTVRTYTVTFYNENGTIILDRVMVEYGTNAIYTKELPSKNATDDNTYEFENWVTEKGGNVIDDLTNVVGDRSVYASFKATARLVSVYFVSNNMEYGSVSVPALNNIPYGAKINVNGNEITIDNQTVVASAAEATAQYTYAFESWTTSETVGNNTIIVANFARSVNNYTVTWMNGDVVLEVDEVAYGTTPVYNGETPTKEADNEYSYLFSGWTPAISSVTENVTYMANFSTSENSHLVIFYDEDGKTELGRIVVEHNKNAVYPNALPTKESTAQTTYVFDNWVSEIGGATVADLSSISSNMNVYASYKSFVRVYTITFMDWDGTIIKTAEVEYGSGIIEVGKPEREGYRFIGWDKPADYIITADTSVTAKYLKQYEVKFVDSNDNTVLDLQFVDEGGNAKEPELLEKDGYRFINWSNSFDAVYEDLIIYAIYSEEFTVTFLDYDGTVLSTVKVIEGEEVTAPSAPSLEGYRFTGWDKTFDNIEGDLNVTATYVANKYNVTFVMPDGTFISESEVEYKFGAPVPSVPEAIVVDKNGSMTVCGFTGWDKDFSKITEETVVTAVYDSEYAGVAVIVEISNNKATIYVAKNKQKLLYAMEISANYAIDIDVGNITIDSVNVSKAGVFNVSNGESEVFDCIINDNEKTLSLVWTNTNGEAFAYVDTAMTVNFSTSGISSVGKGDFKIIECSAILGDENAEKLEQVEAIIIYR